MHFANEIVSYSQIGDEGEDQDGQQHDPVIDPIGGYGNEVRDPGIGEMREHVEGEDQDGEIGPPLTRTPVMANEQVGNEEIESHRHPGPDPGRRNVAEHGTLGGESPGPPAHGDRGGLDRIGQADREETGQRNEREDLVPGPGNPACDPKRQEGSQIEG